MKDSREDYSPAEAAKRRDDALRRALSTPPTKHAPLNKKRQKKPAG